MIEAKFDLLVLFSQVLILLSQVPVCFLEVADGDLCSFDLPFKGSDLLVLLDCELLEDG
jgi:hypothetical protein